MPDLKLFSLKLFSRDAFFDNRFGHLKTDDEEALGADCENDAFDDQFIPLLDYNLASTSEDSFWRYVW